MIFKLSITKELFEDILLKKITTIEKKANNHYKKELLEPIIIDNELFFDIKKIKKIKLINGLEATKPQIIIECLKIEYLKDKSIFKIYLGEILEQKNIKEFKDNKDVIIEKLIDEKKELMKILQEIKKNIS